MTPQEELIFKGNKNKPVLIGAHSGKNKSEEKTKAGTLDKYLDDEEYKDSVLNPKKFLGQDWSVDLNKEFIRGTILANRKVILVTNFDYYVKFFNDKNILNNGTFYELLALKENGFEFKKGSDGKILIIPPVIPVISPNLSGFEDYKKIYEANSRADRSKIMEEKFKEVYQKKITELINSIEGATLLQTPTILTTLTTKISEESKAKITVLQQIQLKQEGPEQSGDAVLEKTTPPEKKQKTENSGANKGKSSYSGLESMSSVTDEDKHPGSPKRGLR